MKNYQIVSLESEKDLNYDEELEKGISIGFPRFKSY